MIFIAKHLSMHGHHCLIYADDIVLFSSHKFFIIVIVDLNRVLHDLNIILTQSSFIVAFEKCKAVIFTQRRYTHPLNVFLDHNIIPLVQNIAYLGINLDPKLHWVSHIQYLTSFSCQWSNFLRSIAGTWWGSYPSSLLAVYISVIRSKFDYGCFLFGSASFFNWEKINRLQTSYLRIIMSYIRSTPCPVIEVKTLCPPINIRCHRLADKFILKSLSNS